MVVVRVVVVMMVMVEKCWCGGGDHIWSLVALHVRCQGGRSVIASITDGTLEWFPMIVGLEMNFQVVAT